MRVLVTGAGGFLGQRIAASLLEQGVERLRLHFRGRPPRGLVEALQSRFPQAAIETAAANLLYRGELDAAVEGVDCVVHAAAGMRGAAADMFANTVVRTRNLLDAAVAAGVRRVVLVSSFAVYRTGVLETGAVHDESVPIEEVGIDKGAYAHAKTRQEHLVASYRAAHGLETVTLRPGVIYGPGSAGPSNRVGISAMGLFFSLGGRAELPLTYVDNCADAIAIAALRAPDGAAYSVVDDDLRPAPPTCAPTAPAASACTCCRCRTGHCCSARAHWWPTTAARRGSCRRSSPPTSCARSIAPSAIRTPRSRRSGGCRACRPPRGCRGRSRRSPAPEGRIGDVPAFQARWAGARIALRPEPARACAYRRS